CTAKSSICTTTRSDKPRRHDLTMGCHYIQGSNNVQMCKYRNKDGLTYKYSYHVIGCQHLTKTKQDKKYCIAHNICDTCEEHKYSGCSAGSGCSNVNCSYHHVNTVHQHHSNTCSHSTNQPEVPCTTQHSCSDP